MGCHALCQGSDPGIESACLMSPALAGRFFTTGTAQEAQPDHRHMSEAWMQTCPPSLSHLPTLHCRLNDSSQGIWEESWEKPPRCEVSQVHHIGKHSIVTEVTDSSWALTVVWRGVSLGTEPALLCLPQIRHPRRGFFFWKCTLHLTLRKELCAKEQNLWFLLSIFQFNQNWIISCVWPLPKEYI